LLERRLNWLATISGVAPMFGFLGCVSGIIVMMQSIESSPTNNSMKFLSNGIWEALASTLYGLVVGTISYISYNYFVATLDRYNKEMEIATDEIVQLLCSNEQHFIKAKEEKVNSRISQQKISSYTQETKTTSNATAGKRRTFGDDDFF